MVTTVLLVYCCYLGGIRQVRRKVLKLTLAVVGEPSIIFLPNKNQFHNTSSVSDQSSDTIDFRINAAQEEANDIIPARD